MRESQVGDTASFLKYQSRSLYSQDHHDHPCYKTYLDWALIAVLPFIGHHGCLQPAYAAAVSTSGSSSRGCEALAGLLWLFKALAAHMHWPQQQQQQASGAMALQGSSRGA